MCLCRATCSPSLERAALGTNNAGATHGEQPNASGEADAHAYSAGARGQAREGSQDTANRLNATQPPQDA